MLILNFWTYLFVVWYQKFGAWLGSTLSLTWTLTHGHTWCLGQQVKGWLLRVKEMGKEWISFLGLSQKMYHTLEGLKQYKFIVSKSRKLEDQSQGIHRAMLPPEALGKDTSLPLPASGGSWQSLASLGL